MAQFDDRERGEEARFAHSAELQFKAEARRNRLVGLWAAEQLGLSGPGADAYARDVVSANFEAPGGRGVMRKIASDLAAKNVAVPESAIAQKMDELLASAIAQLKTGQ